MGSISHIWKFEKYVNTSNHNEYLNIRIITEILLQKTYDQPKTSKGQWNAFGGGGRQGDPILLNLIQQDKM